MDDKPVIAKVTAHGNFVLDNNAVHKNVQANISKIPIPDFIAPPPPEPSIAQAHAMILDSIKNNPLYRQKEDNNAG